MTITLTNQVQRLRDKLAKYVQACIEKQQVNAEAAQYFLDELRAMPTMPRYALTGLSQVGKTTIIDVLLGKVAANCIDGTYFIHERVHMLYPPNTFLHDIESLAESILQIGPPTAIDEKSDTVLWVTQYGNIGSAEEIDYLAAYKAAGKRIICIVNMIDIHDQLMESSLMPQLELQMQPIEAYVERVFPVSASYAKTAQEFYDDALYERSGFPQVEAFLEDTETFFVEQMKQCWALFEPFGEYIDALMKTAYKDIESYVKQFKQMIRETVQADDDALAAIANTPLLSYLPTYNEQIDAYMLHDYFFQSSMKEVVLALETLFFAPATLQELEDLMAKLLHVEEQLPAHHVYYTLQALYAQFHEQAAQLARSQKQAALQQWKEARTVTFLQHEEIMAYDEAYEFHQSFIEKLSALFEQPLPVSLRPIELTIEEEMPTFVFADDFELPFTSEAFIGAYIAEQMKRFFDETEQQLDATESVIREMTQIIDSGIRDEEMMRQFHERVAQAETINELLLLFDGTFEEQQQMSERFELFHELIENYRMMEAKIDVYDEQAVQTLAQNEEQYRATIAPYRHLALLTNRDKQELHAIVRDYEGVQAFREQQYAELRRAYEELEAQATEHKQMLIHQYDQYMKRYKEQIQQRESVMSEWRMALEERQETLVKRDRLRILQNSKLVIAHTQQAALQAIEPRIDLLLLRIEQLYDYDLPALPTYDASLYATTSIKEAALPVECETPHFTHIETIPAIYEKMPYRGLFISGLSVVTIVVLFGVVYGALFMLGIVDMPVDELLADALHW